jgi:epoxyqueuosine reductase QueG
MFVEEDVLKKYAEVVAEQNKLIQELVDKAKKTIAFFVIYVPKHLPDEAREQYRALASRVKEIWGGGVERG